MQLSGSCERTSGLESHLLDLILTSMGRGRRRPRLLNRVELYAQTGEKVSRHRPKKPDVIRGAAKLQHCIRRGRRSQVKMKSCPRNQTCHNQHISPYKGLFVFLGWCLRYSATGEWSRTTRAKPPSDRRFEPSSGLAAAHRLRRQLFAPDQTSARTTPDAPRNLRRRRLYR